MLPVGLFTYASYLLYDLFPTTMMLIVILILLFFSVMLAVVIFGKLQGASLKQVESPNMIVAPEVEDNLIYITPQDFSDKLEPQSGKLFIADVFNEVDQTIKRLDYQKLNDRCEMRFNDGLMVEVTGVQTIGVGDVQFCIFGFEKMIIHTKKSTFTLYWDDNFLCKSVGNTSEQLHLHDGDPVLAFAWGDVSESNNW
jgi:hypothetical protein